MSDESAMMVGSAAVFAVTDMTASVTYYRDVLGFDVTFQYGEPIYYTCLCRDEVALHLNSSDNTRRLPGSGSLCVFVRDVDDLYAELVARGAKSQRAADLRLRHARFRHPRSRRQSTGLRYGCIGGRLKVSRADTKSSFRLKIIIQSVV